MTASQRLIAAARKAIALINNEDHEESALILNALELLRIQRTVALRTFGARDPHIAELDIEAATLRARARQLGAAWA